MILAVSLALTIAMVALTLTRSPLRVLRVGAQERAELATTVGAAAVCQANEVLPAGVTAIRLIMEAQFGPSLLVRAYSGSRLLTEGRRAADWTGGSVTVGVKPVNHTVTHVKLCFKVLANSELIDVVGAKTSAREAAVSPTGQALGGRFSVEYLAPAGGSWWSRALSVARRMGLGHALSGTRVALLVAALMAAVAFLALWLALRALP
jgi:hypothetical protein